MKRRDLLISGFAAALCAGCGENAIGNNVIALVRGKVGPPTPKITRAYAEKLPYASLSVQLGSRDPALFVLARVEDRDLVWRAGKELVLVTRAGRVNQSAGLPANLRQTWIRGVDPLTVAPQNMREPAEFVRMADLQAEDGEIQTIALISRMRPMGSERIVVYGESFDTMLLVEETRARGMDWKFTNRFWVDVRTGLVRRSTQFVVPKLPALRLEVLKPAAQELEFLRNPDPTLPL